MACQPTAADTSISSAEWIAGFHSRLATRDVADWALADWVVNGRAAGLKTTSKAIGDALDIPHTKLGELRRVALAFPCDRRDTRLSFETHAQLASFPEAERFEIATRAAAEGWGLRSARRVAIKHRQDLAGFVDEDLDTPQAVLIMRAWNRASPEARLYFAELQAAAGLGIVDEETACAV